MYGICQSCVVYQLECGTSILKNLRPMQVAVPALLIILFILYPTTFQKIINGNGKVEVVLL